LVLTSCVTPSPKPSYPYFSQIRQADARSCYTFSGPPSSISCFPPPPTSWPCDPAPPIPILINQRKVLERGLVDGACPHGMSIRYFVLEQRLKYIWINPKETLAGITIARINRSRKIWLQIDIEIPIFRVGQRSERIQHLGTVIIVPGTHGGIGKDIVGTKDFLKPRVCLLLRNADLDSLVRIKFQCQLSVC